MYSQQTTLKLNEDLSLLIYILETSKKTVQLLWHPTTEDQNLEIFSCLLD